MKQRRVIEQAANYIHRRRRRRFWARAVAVMAAVTVFATTYMMILPAITMGHNLFEIEVEEESGIPGTPVEARLTAEADGDREETVFFLAVDGKNAGLDDSSLIFDGEHTAVITDENGKQITLHREYREDGSAEYWFALAEGQRSEFSLSFVNGIDRIAAVENEEQPEELPEIQDPSSQDSVSGEEETGREDEAQSPEEPADSEEEEGNFEDSAAGSGAEDPDAAETLPQEPAGQEEDAETLPQEPGGQEDAAETLPQEPAGQTEDPGAASAGAAEDAEEADAGEGPAGSEEPEGQQPEVSLYEQNIPTVWAAPEDGNELEGAGEDGEADQASSYTEMLLEEGDPDQEGFLTLYYGSGASLEEARNNAYAGDPRQLSWMNGKDPEAEDDLQADGPEEGEQVLELFGDGTVEPLCGLEGHIHTEDCRSESGELICGMDEHRHEDSCWPETEQRTLEEVLEEIQEEAFQAVEAAEEEAAMEEAAAALQTFAAESAAAPDGVSLLAAPSGGTALSAASNCSYSVTVTSSNGTFTEGQSGTVNTSNFMVALEVTFNTGWADANGGQTVYYYKIPDGLSFAGRSGTLADNTGTIYGQYEFTSDGYIVIRLNDNTIGDYYSLNMNIQGTAKTNSDEDEIFVFEHGPTITVPKGSQEGSSALYSKSLVGDPQENPDGSITYTYRITVTADGQSLKGVYIRDEFQTTGLEVDDFEMSPTYDARITWQTLGGVSWAREEEGEFGYNLSDAETIKLWTGTAPADAEIQGSFQTYDESSGGAFHFYISELPKDRTIAFNYSITVKEDARKEVDAAGGSYAIGNTAEFRHRVDESEIKLGTSSTYTPYLSDGKWLTKTSAAPIKESVTWTLEAGNENYTLNGLYLTDEIAAPAYDAGVEYITNVPASVVIRNVNTGEEETLNLTWVEVGSLGALTDAQKQDNTNIYYCGNSFAWYSGTDTEEGNTDPYMYTLTYKTTYVEEVFSSTNQINGAYVHYKGHISGVDPSGTQMAEIGLSKALLELSDEGMVTYVSEIHSNGKFAADHFRLYDYMPYTSANDGDRLASLESLLQYAHAHGVQEIENWDLDTVKQKLDSDQKAFRRGDQYALIFDTVAEFEEVSGFQISVYGDDGAQLDEDELLTSGGTKLLFVFNGKPVPGISGNYYALQFNVSAENTQELVDGVLPGGSSLIEYEQGYTIRISYETTAHKWGDSDYAGRSFVNNQELRFRVPEISSAEQSQWAAAYYFFDVPSDSTILDKYIANIQDRGDTVELTYTINADLESVKDSPGGIVLADGLSGVEGADLTNIENYDEFLKNITISFHYRGSEITLTGEDIVTGEFGYLVSSGLIRIITKGTEYFDTIASVMNPYECIFGLYLSNGVLQALDDPNVTLSYTLTLNKDEMDLTAEDYSLRNLIRLYAYHSANDIRPVSESWADYGLTEDVLGKYQIRRPSAENNHLASWQIVVDVDKLEPKDSSSFTVIDRLDSSQIVISSSLKVYGIDSDGTKTEITEGVQYTYNQELNVLMAAVADTSEGKWNYPSYSMEYQTGFRGSPGETIEYTNTAGIVGMSDSNKTVEDSFYIEENYGNISGQTASIHVYKYDSNAVTDEVQGAEFTLYAMVTPPDTGKNIQYKETMTADDFLEANAEQWTEIVTGTTDGNGEITWSYNGTTDCQYIIPGVLFKLEETAAPAGYAEADPVYGYIPITESGSGADSADPWLQLFNPFPTSFQNNSSAAQVYVSDTSLSALEVRKVDGTGQPLSGARFGLYSDETCTQLVRQAVEFANGVHEFGDLAPGTYYVKEISAPEGYRPIASALKIVVSEVGIVPESGQEGESAWQLSRDGSGWYIQAANYSGYELPETGGTGTAAYILGGGLLTAVSALLYRWILRRKEGGVS